MANCTKCSAEKKSARSPLCRSCATAAQWARVRSGEPGGRTIRLRNCKVCSVEMPASYSGRRLYCSSSCEHKYWRSQDVEKMRATGRQDSRRPARRLSYSKHQAQRRGLTWSIDATTHRKLTALPCHYCVGVLPETGSGLDRIDNARGYEPDNVVPCCSDCNRIKCHLLTHGEMLWVAQALKAYRYSHRLRLVNASEG